jgi:hypothetical protein
MTANEPNRPKFRGVWSVWPALLAVALHFALREVLKPWLNAPSDLRFWGAVAILAVPLIFAVFAFVRAIVPPKRR